MAQSDTTTPQAGGLRIIELLQQQHLQPPPPISLQPSSPPTPVQTADNTSETRITETIEEPQSGTNNETTFISDNFENNGSGILSYHSFMNWIVKNGTVDLIGNGFYDMPGGDGLYIDLDGANADAGILESKEEFKLIPGKYILEFHISGSFQGDTNNVTVRLGNAFTEIFTKESDSPFEHIVRTIVVSQPTSATLSFDHHGGDNYGIKLDNVKLSRNSTSEAIIQQVQQHPPPPISLQPSSPPTPVQTADNTTETTTGTLYLQQLQQGPCPEGFFINQTANKCQERPVTIPTTETTTGTTEEILQQGPCPEGFFINQTANKCQERPVTIPTTETAEKYFNEGLLQSKKENYTKAIEYFDKALAIDPNNALVLYKKGLALYNLSKYEEAILWYDKALRYILTILMHFTTKVLL